MKRDKFDDLMSKLIRERANWTCEWPTCGRYFTEGGRGGLHHAHHWGRRRHSVRWDPENGAALCFGHHTYVDSNPDEHKKFSEGLLGTDKYAALLLRANATKRWTEKQKIELYAQMKAALKDMQERRAMGHTGRLEFYLEAT